MTCHSMTPHPDGRNIMSSHAEAARAAFGPLLAETARRWRRAVDRGLHPFGLTEATWLPLIRLARSPTAMRQKDLAAALSLDGSAVVRLLDSLEAAGLIERREEGADRRAKLPVLTRSGREMVGRVEAVARQVRDAAFAGLSDEEIEATSRILAHVSRTLAGDAGKQGS
jgi:MarR family transcriptional regulator for hemolysin